MMYPFKRWVEWTELISQIPDMEARIDYEERFGILRITVVKKEMVQIPTGPEPNQDLNLKKDK